MRILVTNDDGIDAPGLHAVATALADDGYEITIAAPRDERSGSGSSLGTLEHEAEISYVERRFAHLPGVQAISYDAPPAFAVFAACAGVFGAPPDLVVSGINPGPNTGRMILNSSTVAAALTASTLGVRGLAVSCGFPPDHRFDTASRIAVSAARWMLAHSPRRTVLNINVPDLDVSDVKGVRMAPLAPRGLLGLTFDKTSEVVRLLRFANTERLGTGTDSALVRDGYVSISAITAVEATSEGSDVAAHVEGCLPLPAAVTES
ncbi:MULTISPECIES: 5'/3'-nucleotidase SurE [Rhodococcus]|uniref:5'-nucleotidase n=1 Tax=Rhodococcus oxybenzonivorans TaxID=1990687 RepID=A0AAE5A593_9NOCA|nr:MULTISPECIES: 5'/3'-nucleotidase SurE [Rhodococcus]MDV7243646.1 5'/3'-nucleotidase SurE [Rhodococcus oxybenzonivorans]MDV7264291.1 5'/3'-nucleotidase SurE [Rhodococcus oxybenzonivorans]MDV7275112.1 5'/3'-nucleotidase SurE [Rhodococcus oxybenzonivorans]MDV7335350.1 5'/3'-nucleotidase SurE [Rhodococcus oxybenzonivorans]MDV7346061.1 5'/3'-nucleotidase SurE [Rhodococcus oxybenzonivorans]